MSEENDGVVGTISPPTEEEVPVNTPAIPLTTMLTLLVGINDQLVNCQLGIQKLNSEIQQVITKCIETINPGAAEETNDGDTNDDD